MWSNKAARVMVNRRDHAVLEAGLSQYKLDTRNQENAKYFFILWGKKYRGGLHICLISKWSFIQSCEEIQIPCVELWWSLVNTNNSVSKK